MKNHRRKLIKFGLFWLAILVIVACSGTFFSFWQKPTETEFGATFSNIYAESLGLDWQDTYMAVLNDLQVKKIRIPIYWSTIERSVDEYDFSDIDWMMRQAQWSGVDVTLVVGAKVPRWPECFYPDWVSSEDVAYRKQAHLDFLTQTVERYAKHSALERWQIENEPFFPFGNCPPPDSILLDEEIALVKTYDQEHSIQLTSSGEQSLWLVNGSRAEVLGVSLYRVVWNDILGYWVFPFPPAFYRIQNFLVSPLVNEVVISEMQAEPWITDEMLTWSSGKKYELFNQQDLRDNVEFARRTGINKIYFWGVEWWYYLKTQGDDRLWETGKEIINH
ncbi:MAG: hypothetical protein ABH846_04995 [Patescibacteria group bacterium]